MDNISVKLRLLSSDFSVSPISRFTKTGFNFYVDIKQIRRSNMLSLIEREKTKAAFAGKVGTDAAYISQILSEKTKAEVGDRLARGIEAAYKLPHGWMDREHGQAEELPQNDLADAWSYLLPEEQSDLEAEIKRRAEHNKAAGARFAEKSGKGKRLRDPKIIDPTLPAYNEFTDYADQRKHERREQQEAIEWDRRVKGERRKDK